MLAASKLASPLLAKVEFPTVGFPALSNDAFSWMQEGTKVTVRDGDVVLRFAPFANSLSALRGFLIRSE